MNDRFNHARDLRNGVKEDDRRWIATLNRHEIVMIEGVTREKLGIEDARQIQNRVADYHKRLDAFGAELAFCKLFGVYRDFDMQYLGYDVVITLRYEDREETKTIDVKQTAYNDGKLLVDAGCKACDLYVLMVGQFPTFVYRGSMPGEIICKPENIEVIGGKRVYAVKQHRLSMSLFV